MNKFKLALLVSGVALALSGCQTLNPQDIHTTASKQTIETAKKQITATQNKAYDLAVYDNGVIYIKFKKPPGRNWATAQNNEASYRISCQNFRSFVDQGMVVDINFQGGATQQYNQHRCETETPTNFYSNWKK